MLEELHKKFGENLNPGEKDFLERLILTQAENTYRKFAEGAKNHGHKFLDLSEEDLLQELKDEYTDSGTYLFRVKELRLKHIALNAPNGNLNVNADNKADKVS